MTTRSEFRREWVARDKARAQDTVRMIAKRLREKADELDRRADDLFEENRYSTPADRARSVLHEILWMVPNLPLDHLLSQVDKVRQLEEASDGEDN